MEVQIYTKTDCPFCVQAKQWFKEFNIDVIEHCMDVEEDRLSFFQRINHNQEQLGENCHKLILYHKFMWMGIVLVDMQSYLKNKKQF